MEAIGDCMHHILPIIDGEITTVNAKFWDSRQNFVKHHPRASLSNKGKNDQYGGIKHGHNHGVLGLLTSEG